MNGIGATIPIGPHYSEELNAQLESARETMQKIGDARLLCPHCGAPLETKDYREECDEYESYDVEVIDYECGLRPMDRVEVEPCKNSRSSPNSKPTR